MRESITGHAVFNTNQMLRRSDPRIVILLESDADQSFLGLHLNHDLARCALGFSKSAVLLAAQLHAEANDAWVSAVVDRDIVPFQPVKNLFVTSHYDLESEAFFAARRDVDRLVYAHVVTEENHATADPRTAHEIVDAAVELATVIGIVRAVVVRDNMGLRMSHLPLPEIVRRARNVDYVTAVVAVACMRARAVDQALALESEARSELAAVHYGMSLCCGHDLLGALATLLGDAVGARVKTRDLTRSFHSIVACSTFSQLSIFEPLRSWCLQVRGGELWDCAA